MRRNRQNGLRDSNALMKSTVAGLPNTVAGKKAVVHYHANHMRVSPVARHVVHRGPVPSGACGAE